MNTLLHADIFFFVATIGFIVIFVLLIIALIYLILVFKTIHRVTLKIEKDISNIGDTAKDFVMQLWDSTIFSWIFGKKKRSRKGVE